MSSKDKLHFHLCMALQKEHDIPKCVKIQPNSECTFDFIFILIISYRK